MPATPQTPAHDAPRWSSPLSFIMAASAATVGLGNIWRFPSLTGQHGGALFVLLYLFFVALLGFPLLLAEVLIGRLSRSGPAEAFNQLRVFLRGRTLWRAAGILQLLAGFFILTYYAVITGWVLEYTVYSLMGILRHLNEAQSQVLFSQTMASAPTMLASDTVVMLGATAIGALGLKAGLERVVRFLFPALFILLLVLLGVAFTTPRFGPAMHYLFHPDVHQLNLHTLLLALGQAFFSLNIAVGVTMLFGAYLPKQASAVRCVAAVVGFDTLIALLAGMIVFPIAMNHHVAVESGPSLIFKTLPLGFQALPWAQGLCSLFFLMLGMAAFTSVMGFMEPFTHWIEHQWQRSRAQAAVITGVLAWVISLASVISFNLAQHWQPGGKTLFGWIDFSTANIMLPLGGIMLALFAGWFLPTHTLRDELNWNMQSRAFRLWRFLLRWFIPAAIACLLVTHALS